MLFRSNRETFGPGEKVNESIPLLLNAIPTVTLKDRTADGNAEAVLYGYVKGTGGVEDTSDTVTVKCE